MTQELVTLGWRQWRITKLRGIGGRSTGLPSPSHVPGTLCSPMPSPKCQGSRRTARGKELWAYARPSVTLHLPSFSLPPQAFPCPCSHVSHIYCEPQIIIRPSESDKDRNGEKPVRREVCQRSPLGTVGLQVKQGWTSQETGKSFSLGDGWSMVLGFGAGWRPEATEEAGAWKVATGSI